MWQAEPVDDVRHAPQFGQAGTNITVRNTPRNEGDTGRSSCQSRNTAGEAPDGFDKPSPAFRCLFATATNRGSRQPDRTRDRAAGMTAPLPVVDEIMTACQPCIMMP